MKTNEFRIGNLVNTSERAGIHYQICKQGMVRTINNASINITPDKCTSPVVTINFKNIEPIPLTEEWLLKFGFEKRKETGMSVCDSWQGLDYWFNDRKDCLILRGEPIHGLSYQGSIRAYPQRNIKYVHQLQNLYFALTGEELTIKDK